MKELLCLFSVLTLVVMAVLLVTAFFRGDPTAFALANAIDTGTHDGPITRIADAAISRYLLVKVGATDTSVDVNGVTDRPLGTTTNEASAANDRIPVKLLSEDETSLMIASEALVVGDVIYTAASGKVQNEPATAGTYWRIGRALTAAAADGDVVEVMTNPPIKVVVIAAFTSTDGTAAAASASLANLAAEAEKIGDDVRSIRAALTGGPAEIKCL
jgi:hypothetical protein